ncbi:MAG TPA: shikimate dehydrogenase [Tepidisphaeraceae bacterium]|jgi:3-dehydroquinate dehydratase/shikimate dehydrogenase|nr:shikimate dehydrogenase [Tepidisphaeraceae bacterium]
MTHLCVPIFVTELAKARREVAAAAAAGADLVELRIDKLRDMNALMLLLEDKILPAVVTCRSQSEGGHSQLDDAERMSRLASAINGGAALVDLELQALPQMPQIPDKIQSRLIISAHDFSATPGDLNKIVEEMNAMPAEVNKIVWRAGNILDNLDALKLLIHPSRPTVALCMGEVGLLSRVLARKFGAFLTFASLDHESATAPGQVMIAEMKNLYRWDDIGPATKVFGVVAHPVRHSMSPAIHNAAFTATGYDGVYLPLLVEPDYTSFKAFMDEFVRFEELNLSGLSVTIPHKENALRYLTQNGAAVEELAQIIGAVNTIVIRRGPGSAPVLSGKNTDYAAILDSITTELDMDRENLAELRVAVLGAGGTARAAVAGLAHYGATVIVSNRTRERAQSLADEFNGRRGKVSAVALDEVLRSDFQVFINTTSVGMYPNIGENPLGEHRPPFSARTLVFDTIYNPLKTQLIAQAEGLGARTISGVEMFVRQAAAQFETWTGKTAPQPVMRRVISERLGLPLHTR